MKIRENANIRPIVLETLILKYELKGKARKKVKAFNLIPFDSSQKISNL